MPNDSTGAAGALQLAASWIQECASKHDDCKLTSSQEGARFVPTRLIDVSEGDIHLIESAKHFSKTEDRRYVALSHCWGKIHIIRTLKDNYQEHLSRIKPQGLSKTFTDAVHATRELGFRYLWIDSLCIIQDDSKDWATEAATMCNVYQNASLTIAAAHAPGGDVGCFKDRDGLQQVPFVVEIPRKEYPDSPAHVVFTSYGRGEGLGGQEPPLYGRAWVLQEQILSPRMLIFDGAQLRWECLTTHASERSHVGGMSRHAGHQKAIRKAIVSDTDFFTGEGDGANYQHLYWCYVVMDYTHRGMTQSTDRLVALAGIAQALGRYTESEYLAGLWSRFFWAGMLWSISHVNEYISTTSGAFSLEENLHSRQSKPIAPSWSWASVTVPVVYASPTIVSLDPICTIQHTVVSGSAAEQSGCVWVNGHTRKGFVNAIYPYAIREASSNHLGHMTMQKPEGQKDRIVFKGRAVDPSGYFLFSPTRPNMPKLWGSDLHPNIYITKNEDWRLIRGTFRPDEIIDPTQEITFVAIAQQHAGKHETSHRTTHEPDDPLSVYTIALLPLDDSGEKSSEYRRVGYAVWTDCAWYGYNCGSKERPGLEVERPGRWTPEYGWQADDGVFNMLRWWTKWKNLEFYKPGQGGTHTHDYEAEVLPDLRKYHKDVEVAAEVINIV